MPKRSISKFWWSSVGWSFGAGVFIFVGMTFLFPHSTVMQKLIRAAILPVVGIGLCSIFAVLFYFAERWEKAQTMNTKGTGDEVIKE